MRTRLGLVVVAGLVVCMLVPAAIGQGELDYTPRMPRPVDAESRAELGYPAPRDVETVLAAFDELVEPTPPELGDEPTPETLAVLKAYRESLRCFHEVRVNLVSELEESSYEGPGLDELLNSKVESLAFLWQWNTQRLENHFLGALSSVRWNHKDRPAGLRAEWVRMSAMLWEMQVCQFAPRDEDLGRVSELELKLPYGNERAGSLLLRAIGAHPKDSEIHRKWLGWMLVNLPPESEGFKVAKSESGVGQPLAIQGSGLDGTNINTQDWLGHVVIVDVWGLWCQPCVESMPELKRVYDVHRDRGLKVVGVFADWRPDQGRAFLAEHGYDWPQIVDPAIYESKKFGSHHIVQQLHVRGYPTVLIIDRDGILRVRDHFPNLEKEVLHWLDTPASSGPAPTP